MIFDLLRESRFTPGLAASFCAARRSASRMYAFMPRPLFAISAGTVEPVMVVLVPIVQCLSSEKLTEWNAQDRWQFVPEYRRRDNNPAPGCVKLLSRDADLSG